MSLVTRVRRSAPALRHLPFTLSLAVVLIVVGLATGALWHPFEGSPLFSTFAYGVPAFEQGRWWTLVTGAVVLHAPWAYAIALPGLAGLAFVEYRRGSRVASLYFVGGQLFAVLGAALVLWLSAMLPWPWAQQQAAVLAVGPSAGVIAGVAAAVTLLPSPWRLRGWTVLLTTLVTTVFYWGSLPDLERLLAVAAVLVVDRSYRPQRVSVREQRLIAFVITLALGTLEVLAYLSPTTGPFGSSPATAGSWIDVAVTALVVLLVARGMRRGRRWAWVVLVVFAVVNALVVVVIVGLVVVFGSELLDAETAADISTTLASSTIWTALLVYLVLVRGAFRARPRGALGDLPAPTADEARETLRRHGGGTLSWMTTWEGMSYARFHDGVVAFQRRSGVALALADPLGPVASRAATVRAFVDRAEAAGLAPCFFSAGEATKDAVPEGWRSIVVADDAVMHLPGLQFTGKSWNSVRTALNKAAREGITFRISRLADEPWGVRQQVRAISDAWVGDKGLPEMGFTLGSLTEAADPETRVALAISPEGDVDGFLSWLPIFGEGHVRGWTLDLMRRREGGFGPVIEYLIGSSALQFSTEGAEVLSLSGAPLTHEYPADAGVVADLQERLAAMLEPVYGFASLHRFKQKFQPRSEPMYLLYRDESDLTRIGAALTRAFLPHATMRQFAAAGIELVRHES